MRVLCGCEYCHNSFFLLAYTLAMSFPAFTSAAAAAAFATRASGESSGAGVVTPAPSAARAERRALPPHVDVRFVGMDAWRIVCSFLCVVGQFRMIRVSKWLRDVLHGDSATPLRRLPRQADISAHANRVASAVLIHPDTRKPRWPWLSRHLTRLDYFVTENADNVECTATSLPRLEVLVQDVFSERDHPVSGKTGPVDNILGNLGTIAPMLRVLHVEGVQMTDEMLHGVVVGCHFLEEFHGRGCTRQITAHTPFGAIAALPNMRVFHVSNTPVGCEVFRNASRRMQSIEVSDTHVGSAGLQFIAARCPELEHIETFNAFSLGIARDTELFATRLEAAWLAVCSGCPRLRSIDIGTTLGSSLATARMMARVIAGRVPLLEAIAIDVGLVMSARGFDAVIARDVLAAAHPGVKLYADRSEIPNLHYGPSGHRRTAITLYQDRPAIPHRHLIALSNNSRRQYCFGHRVCVSTKRPSLLRDS